MSSNNSKNTANSVETACIHQNMMEENSQNQHMVFNPVYRGSTIVFDKYEDFLVSKASKVENIADIKPYPYYGRAGNPTIHELSRTISWLEKGDFTVITNGGMSAVTTAILSCLSSGDHAIFFDGIYTSTHHFIAGILPKYNITYDICDEFLEGDLEAKLKPNTKVIFFESCASGTFEVADIEKIVAFARKHNIITICDNTMFTPILLNPIEHGVDFVVHSLSKFAMGHADAMLGSVTTTAKYFKILYDYSTLIGNHANSEAAYLALRGIKTMPLRVRDSVIRAEKIMNFLQSHPLVKEVLHPYTFTDDRRKNVEKYCKNGVTGLFGVLLKKKYSAEELAKFFNSLKFFKIGLSWGGFESLCIDHKLTYRKGKIAKLDEYTYLRMYVGMENSDDLIADLGESLAKL